MWWAILIFALLIIVTVVILTMVPKDPPPSTNDKIVLTSALYSEDERHCGGSMGSGNLIKNLDVTQTVTDLVNKGSIKNWDFIRPSIACGSDGGGVITVTWSDNSKSLLYYGNEYTF